MSTLDRILCQVNWHAISVKNRLLAVFSFCFIITSISSIFINTYLQLPFEINVIVLIVLIIHSIAFYSSIRNKISDKGRFIYLSILVSFLPLAWIFNGGLIGAIPMYYFLYFGASILSLTRNYRNYFIAYIILLSILSLYIQYFQPELIIPYDSIEAQMDDMKSSFIQVIITTILLTITYTSINDDIQKKLIKQKKRLETSNSKLAKAKKVADEAARAKSNFITNISHEIRTPLTGIVGISNLLNGSPLNEEQKLLVESLNSSSKTLQDLVNDLLDLSKIEANKLTLNNELFELRQTVKEINDLLLVSATAKNLTLNTWVDNKLPRYIELDRNKYKQILINLLSNAVKFTPHGTVTCSISYDATSALLITSVEDTGIGIKTEDINKLYTPFTQLNNPESIDNNGIGMGLAIAKKMIAFMNGEIVVTSNIGQGSCFRFTLPIISIAQPSDSKTTDKSKLFMHKSLHILITEDHKINQVVLAKMLEKLNHTYEIANNGQEAVELCKDKRYDAILMDIQMPILNGIEATKAIANYYNSKDILLPKIIGCSANILQTKDDEHLNEIMTEFLIKPINLEQLENVLNQLQ